MVVHVYGERKRVVLGVQGPLQRVKKVVDFEEGMAVVGNGLSAVVFVH